MPSTSIAFSVHYGNWGASQDFSDHEAVRFWIYPSGAGMPVAVRLENDAGDSFPTVSYGTVPADAWSLVEVDMAELNPNSYPAHRINVMTNDGGTWTYYIDELGLLDIQQAMVSVDWDAEDASFTWDASGNMKSNTGRGVTNISYDTRNLPLSMSLSNGLETFYRYNSAGWRIHKRVEDSGTPSVDEHYIMDGGTLLAVTDSSGTVQFWNLLSVASAKGSMYGNGLIGRQESGGAKKYYVRDHLGSTRQVIDDTGTLLEYYDYYPFGLVLRSGANQFTKETFTGKEQDPATGYHYFGARYYDAALAGWGVTDPAGQFASPYVYAGNPVSYVDPDGQFVFSAILGPVGTIIDAALWSAVIDAGVQGVKIATGAQQGFNFAELGGAFVGGAVGGGLGFVAPSFQGASLVGKYAGKAGYAGFVGAASSSSGMFVTDLLNDGRINFSGRDYLRTAGTSAVIASSISLAYSAHDYVTWDRFSPEEKLDILRNEFELGDVQLKYDDSGFARQLGYEAEYSPFNDPVTISLTEKGLSTHNLARSTLIHELQHHSDIGAINLYRDVGALGNRYVKNYIEQRGYLTELNAATSRNLALRNVISIRRGLSRYGFNGNYPRQNHLRSLWLNIFR